MLPVVAVHEDRLDRPLGRLQMILDRAFETQQGIETVRLDRVVGMDQHMPQAFGARDVPAVHAPPRMERKMGVDERTVEDLGRIARWFVMLDKAPPATDRKS